LLGFGLLMLRLSPEEGRQATFFLLAVVSGTDTGAYFAGRTIGGPKLWPAISPNKTWAGAVGGLAMGLVAGLAVAAVFAVPVGPPLVAVAAVLSIAAQAGDLFESWVKRRFGAKDSGNIVPGHGGLMDRVDGLTFAAALAVLGGWLHGGAGDLAGGLLRW
jgi:phosphatidate cytidylyltransferase